MKILGLIPARGGSKRLPGKNSRDIGGKPLIAWTIDAALDSNVLSDLIVSTDDLQIADISSRCGVSVNEMRPAFLATDTSSSVDVALYELEKYEKSHGPVDGLMLLQPTSPFRKSASILGATKLFGTSGVTSVVSVSHSDIHPAWCYFIENNVMSPVVPNFHNEIRSQDLQKTYVVNGAIYLIAPDLLRKSRKFIQPHTHPFVLTDPTESIDIDSEWDWKIACYMVDDFLRKASNIQSST